jgi:hypothetical protein
VEVNRLGVNFTIRPRRELSDIRNCWEVPLRKDSISIEKTVEALCPRHDKHRLIAICASTWAARQDADLYHSGLARGCRWANGSGSSLGVLKLALLFL